MGRCVFSSFSLLAELELTHSQSPELADFIPRILDSVITSLHNRCKRLHAIGDKRGMEEARTVEQYARAEQRLFSERARESFRR